MGSLAIVWFNRKEEGKKKKFMGLTTKIFIPNKQRKLTNSREVTFNYNNAIENIRNDWQQLKLKNLYITFIFI